MCVTHSMAASDAHMYFASNGKSDLGILGMRIGGAGTGLGSSVAAKGGSRGSKPIRPTQGYDLYIFYVPYVIEWAG
jgi:hypothetical protein